MGGSQGSLAINEAVAGAIDAGLLKNVSLLWATGRVTYERYARHMRPPAVRVWPFLDPIGPAYASADLVVCRAGAMTLAEVTAWGLPSVLIPLPTAAADHQTPNAEALQAAGAAIHLPQSHLGPAVLADRIAGVVGVPARRAEMAAASLRRGRPGAAEAIADRLLSLL
jgi:UDP-N-acetylglucosamine--N-acetylmuramyl-(pentapeptide) pyrophosphoryl-undecaprenol N-acetylglucosamine transferase